MKKRILHQNNVYVSNNKKHLIGGTKMKNSRTLIKKIDTIVQLMPILVAFIGLLILHNPTGFAQASFPCDCPNGPVTYEPVEVPQFRPHNEGTPMLKYTLSGFNSVCNDGTPAIMYIRPANAHYDRGCETSEENPYFQESNKWVIHFQGGGGCRDNDDCWARWCGDEINARAGRMSSLGTPEAASKNSGIFSRNPNSYFSDWNHVFLFYCSSDNWIGSTAQSLTTPGGVSYSIDFRGEDIVNDVFDTLLSGPTQADSYPAETYYDTPLPSLADAEVVVLSGDSAGGVGLRHHVDKLTTLLTSFNPNMVVRAVIDAAVPPALFHPGILWPGPPVSPVDYNDFLLTEMEPSIRTFWGVDNSALDISCLATAVNPMDCYDTTNTLINHITTPFFVRMDLSDPLGSQRSQTYQNFTSRQDYLSALYNQLNSLPTVAIPAIPAGVFGPNCGQHVAIQENPGFFQAAAVNVAGVPGLSFHELLTNWLTGIGPTVQVQNDFNAGPGYTSSYCP